jgi:glycosyltransferase involved in cell wall biosynthesis
MITHYLSPAVKQLFYRLLRVQTHIDRTICYSTPQLQLAYEKLGLRHDQVDLVLHPADHLFWTPQGPEEISADEDLLRQAGLSIPDDVPLICSAGLEYRDYPTLINAVTYLPKGVQVVIAASSPWSKRKNTAADVDLPENVKRVALTPLQLRALYRRATVVAIPLYDVDFQAGSLVAYEAMACGRPVVITRTRGQKDIVLENRTGLYVPQGDPQAMSAALSRLLADKTLADRFGREARLLVERGLNLDAYLTRMVEIVQEVATLQNQSSSARHRAPIIQQDQV